jgi:hypothetical protein
MPAFTAEGKWSQAITAWARSSGTNVALSERSELFGEWEGGAGNCSEAGDGESDNTLSCADFAQFCLSFVDYEELGDAGSRPEDGSRKTRIYGVTAVSPFSFAIDLC